MVKNFLLVGFDGSGGMELNFYLKKPIFLLRL